MHHIRPARWPLGALALAFVVAACSSAGGSVASPSSAPSSPPSGSASPSASDPSTGVVGSSPNLPGDGLPVNAGTLVRPKPGQLDVHSIAADGLAARVDGRHVIVTITWWSGIEPCTVFDHVEVRRTGDSFALTLFEGHGPGNPICIEIAQRFRTEVDISKEDLAPGTYTITDGTGTAPAIEAVVS